MRSCNIAIAPTDGRAYDIDTFVQPVLIEIVTSRPKAASDVENPRSWAEIGTAGMSETLPGQGLRGFCTLLLAADPDHRYLMV